MTGSNGMTVIAIRNEATEAIFAASSAAGEEFAGLRVCNVNNHGRA